MVYLNMRSVLSVLRSGVEAEATCSVDCWVLEEQMLKSGEWEGEGWGVTLGLGSWGTNEHCNASALKSNAILNYFEMHCNVSALKCNVLSPNTLQHKVYSWSWKDVKGNFKIYPPKSKFDISPGICNMELQNNILNQPAGLFLWIGDVCMKPGHFCSEIQNSFRVWIQFSANVELTWLPNLS